MSGKGFPKRIPGRCPTRTTPLQDDFQAWKTIYIRDIQDLKMEYDSEVKSRLLLFNPRTVLVQRISYPTAIGRSSSTPH